MKFITSLFFLIVFLLNTSILFSQAPEKINYQAVARDLSGNPLVSTPVNITYDIRQSTPTGTIVYSETHSLTTNQFGLFTAPIGGGTPVTGTFPGITWGTGLYYLQVTINGDVMPATQLLSVPYALHANTATSGTPGANGHANLADSVSEPAGANCANGGYLIHMGADDNDDGTLQALERDISYYICNGLDGSANTNDTSATNELQTISISATNDTIFLSNGGFIVLPNASGDNDWLVNGNDMSSMPTGNVGIGTTSPLWPLQVQKNNNITLLNINSVGSSHGESNLLFTTNSDQQGWQIFMDDISLDNLSNYEQLGFSHTFYGQTMVLDGPTRNVGIGTTTPGRKLSVETSSTTGDGISINNSSTGNPGIEFQTQSNPRFVMGIDQSDNNKFKIGTTNLFTNTRFTISPLGDVGIGTVNPIHRLTVASTDSIIASFTGANPNASIISVANVNPSAPTGAIFLTGSDSGIVAIDPALNTFFLSNTSSNGHLALTADSSVATYGRFILNSSDAILNETDSIFNYSSNPNGIFHVNQGTFVTDSLYVVGANVANPGWVLANDGFGQAVWTNPSSIGSSNWNINGSGIDYTAGNVGIGTTNPTSTLTINSVVGNDIEFVGGSNADIYSNSQIFMSSFSSTHIDATEIRLGTAALDRLTIVNNGNIGVGTITPQQLFTLSTPTSTTLRMERTNATAFDWEMNVDNLGFHLKGGANAVGPGLTDFVNVDGNGQMGIGITTPTQLLHVFGGTIRIDDGSNPYNLPVSDGSNGQVLTTNGAGITSWQSLSGGGNDTALIDADGDTRIQVESAPDQDVIHFNLGNSTGYTAAEYFTMIGPRLEVINSGLSVFIGENAGANDDLTLNHNTFVGHDAGASNTSGPENVALGSAALLSNSTGGSNTALGREALRMNSTGGANTAAGYRAAQNNTIGALNSSFGYEVLRFNQTGNRNTAFGVAGLQNSTGDNNTSLGADAGVTISTGDNNTFIGKSADAGIANINNATAIGANTVVSQSNSLVLGNGVNVGINNSTPIVSLDINGNDAVLMPRGTNAQRPASALAGMTRYNTSNGNLEYYNGTIWIALGASGSSPWTKSGADIFQTTLTDFVGIGTNTPTEMLSIGAQGTATSVTTQRSSEAIALTGSYWNGSAVNRDFTIQNVASSSVSEQGKLSIVWHGATNKDIFNMKSNGNIGIGMSNPVHLFHVQDSSAAVGKILMRVESNIGSSILNVTNNHQVNLNGQFTLQNGSQGAGKVLVSDATGVSSWKVNQLAFEVESSSIFAIPVGSFGSGSAKVPFNVEIFDDGAVYDPSVTVYEFVAPVSGVYSLETGVTFAHSGGGKTTCSIALVKNGVSVNPIKTSSAVLDQPGDLHSVSISSTVRLAPGDKITVEAVMSSSSSINIQPSPTNKNWFSGHLVYEF